MIVHQLAGMFLTFLVLTVSASAAEGLPGSHGRFSAVRRQAEHLQPEASFDGTSAAAISAKGSSSTILAPEHSAAGSSTSSHVNTLQAYPGQVARHEMTEPASLFASSAWREAVGSQSKILGIVRAHMRPHPVGSLALFAKRYFRLGQEPAPAVPSAPIATDAATSSTDVHSWVIGFFASLLALGYLSSHVGGKMKVQELQADDDLTAARGRPCWAMCCGACVLMISTMTFLITLLVLSTAGASSDDGRSGEVVDYDTGAMRQAKHPGERAYEAGQGVAMSVALMALIIFRRRHLYNVQISSGLLSQFAIRGATMSAIIASVLELVGVFALRHVTGLDSADLMPTPEKMNSGFGLLPVAVTMVMVGMSEELGKACAVMLCTWLVAGAMRLDIPSCFQRYLRVLVESPRALMLVGLAVGCGFMTTENVGYLLSAGLMYDKDDSVAAERIVRCIIVGVRVGLNLHPWLAGISAARMARVTFAEGRESLTLSFKELVWVLWPATALHAFFDFGLVGLPGIMAIFLPPCSWLGARAIFDKEWAMYETRTADADPSEERPDDQQ